ncbi:MAG: dienelactone hydrolase family protein [Chloroflexi bacterium]|nr:dienelactone hydrolase family protein [Chloroflexota bacterium]MBV9602257.1 dienelactone hydrolase family protein [Chloroflexota bacterium]
MPVFAVRPASGRGPGLVMLQEIFGVTDYIKSRARDLASLGYVVLAPQLYWRLGPDVKLPENTQAGLQEAFGYMQRLDEAQAIDDAVATLEHLRAQSETAGKVGVFGFCLGGRLAYGVAVAAEPDVVVSYYGSGIGNLLDAAPRVTAPVVFHFGEADQFLPVDEAHRIEAAFSGHPGTEVHMHSGAGHAFDNPSPMWHHKAASEEAWPQTTAFLQHHLPPAG